MSILLFGSFHLTYQFILTICKECLTIFAIGRVTFYTCGETRTLQSKFRVENSVILDPIKRNKMVGARKGYNVATKIVGI